MSGTYAKLIYHVVFSTKNRNQIINPVLQTRLYDYMGGIIRGEKGSLIKAGGIADHVHLLTVFHPTKSISEMLHRIKGSSSHWVNEHHFQEQYFDWQDGYGAFSVSESKIDSVRAYIERQEDHHQRTDFKDEFRGLLKRHRIPYDENLVWN